MSKVVHQIKAPIAEEMRLFESKFYESMKSRVALLDRITQFIVRRKGKQMRPMFVFLVAKMLGTINEKTFRAASLIELIHTATLVHDDVVDDSNLRRGFFSINALWKNKIAVLVGDFLLSKSVLLSVDNKDYDLLSVISNTIKEMSEGELLQLEKARKLDITEEVYYQIIEQKTATLIAACCKAGALSVTQDKATIENMHQFGQLAGMAFQIKDDLFDYTQKNIIGKPIGIDIQESKMTLPLIYTLNTCSEKDKKWLLQQFKKKNKPKKQIVEIIQFVKDSGGLLYAKEKMNAYYHQALDILLQQPENTYRNSLEMLLQYVIEREK